MKNKIITILLFISLLFLFSAIVSAENVSNITSADIDEIDEINTIDLSSNNQISNQEIRTVSNDVKTYTVDGSSKNQMSNPTIQNAINSANSGDSIEIIGENYEHCHFVIDKNLTIFSNVGTTMTPCPSNTEGSNGLGVFILHLKHQEPLFLDLP